VCTAGETQNPVSANSRSDDAETITSFGSGLPAPRSTARTVSMALPPHDDTTRGALTTSSASSHALDGASTEAPRAIGTIHAKGWVPDTVTPYQRVVRSGAGAMATRTCVASAPSTKPTAWAGRAAPTKVATTQARTVKRRRTIEGHRKRHATLGGLLSCGIQRRVNERSV
jgi:hypothetical protein